MLTQSFQNYEINHSPAPNGFRALPKLRGQAKCPPAPIAPYAAFCIPWTKVKSVLQWLLDRTVREWLPKFRRALLRSIATKGTILDYQYNIIDE